MLKRLLAAFACVACTSAVAAEIPADVQVKLQGVMLDYIDARLSDGEYVYVDTREKALKTLFPANVHPFVVPIGDDYFVCSEMIDDDGNTLTADFLIRRIDGEYKVVQMIVDDREAVSAAIAKLGQ